MHPMGMSVNLMVNLAIIMEHRMRMGANGLLNWRGHFIEVTQILGQVLRVNNIGHLSRGGGLETCHHGLLSKLILGRFQASKFAFGIEHGLEAGLG